MTVPVTLILDEIEARLASITTSNGYNTDIAKIERAKLQPFKRQDFPAASLWVVNKPSVTSEYGIKTHTLNVIVGYFDTTSDTPLADVAAQLELDVNIAMLRATTANKLADTESIDLGGLVSSFEELGADYITGGAEKNVYAGALVSFIIEFKTSVGDPTTIIQE